MIEHGLFHAPAPPAPVTARDRARLECGCMVLVGVRTDTRPPEPATGSMACSSEHQGLMDEFNRRLRQSLADPQPRLMIDVVDELLTEVGACR